MASLTPRPSRIRQNSNKHTPPELNLKKDASTQRKAQSLSSSNSFSSINSQPSYHGLIQGQGQGQQKQALFSSSDSQSGVVGGVTQFQAYSAHHPSYRPYTPTTPTTPSTMSTLAGMPMTPTLATYGSGSNYQTSPRLDRSPSFNSQGQSQGKASSTSNNLLPYAKNQRASSTRRMPSNESSLYDPYRSRQQGVSANRVKSEYQANSPIRENHAVFPTPTYSYYSGHGSSEEVHELHPYAREGGSLIDDQASPMMPPPSISAREDHYRPSPTLTASQTLAANYSAHPEPLYQSYLPYQPYSNQHALPSPSFTDAYRLNSNYASPGVGLLHSNHSYEERTEYKADPYRSAYSQSTSNHQSSSHAHPYGSSYQGSASGSPNPNEDFSSSFESKFSVISTQQNQQNNGSNIPRYPTRDLAGQESDQALSASSEENGSSQQQQQTPTPTEQRQKSTTTVSCETAGPFSDQDFPTTVDNTSGYTKPSSIRPSQLSKTEEDEDDMILQKLGVLSANSTRSGKTHSSGQSRKKGQWTDGSEEESQSKHGMRQRRRRVDHERAQSRRRYDQVCCCSCTTRVCAIVTLGILASLALILYFLIPRAPVFSFESVTSSNPPVTLVDRIQEPFNIQFMVDSSNNYLPIRLNRIGLGIWLDPEQARIADNDDLTSSFVIQPHSQIISIPMTLEYKSKNNVQGPDNVLQDLVQVCTPIDLNTAITIPGMNITVAGVVHIWGFAWIWKPSFKLDIENVPCPINSRDLNSTPPLASSVSSTPSVTAASTVNTASVSPIEAYAAVETQVTTRTAQEYWKATITTRTDMAVQTA